MSKSSKIIIPAFDNQGNSLEALVDSTAKELCKAFGGATVVHAEGYSSEPRRQALQRACQGHRIRSPFNYILQSKIAGFSQGRSRGDGSGSGVCTIPGSNSRDNRTIEEGRGQPLSAPTL